MFFRELPDPLFPRSIYGQLIAAARIEDTRMRLIQVHELVNTLPDANYATLRFLAHHLSEYHLAPHLANITVLPPCRMSTR